MTTTTVGEKKSAPKKAAAENKTLVISAPNLRATTFKIVGASPYVQNKFSEKAKKVIKEDHEAGSKSRTRKKREARDFVADYKAAMHISEEGWNGMPASAFRSAMIDACRLVGFKMTFAKLSVFVEADGFDADDGTPLVRIREGEPEMNISAVRNKSGVVDLRSRPMWRRWSANVKVRWDGDQFSEMDVANLLMRAGMQVGVGEGRYNSKESHGMGWGLFAMAKS